MSLRTRLVLAFFTLSVVPLGAVTFYSYTNNVKALRDAAEREADLLAGELGQRMQLVTAQLSERVEHLMDIAELQAAVDDAAAEQATLEQEVQQAATRPVSKPVPASTSPAFTAPALVTTLSLNDSIAKSLGEAAMLLNNVELQNMRGMGRGGRPPSSTTFTPPPPGGPPPSGTASGLPPSRGGGGGVNVGTGGSGRSFDQNRRGSGRGGPPRSNDQRAGQQGAQGAATGTTASTGAAASTGASSRTAQTAVVPQVTAVPNAQRIGRPPGPPPDAPPPGTPPGPPPMTTVDANGKLMIDMSSIRRDMIRQILPDGNLNNLKPEDRDRIAAEVNQRMLGIAQGIKIGAAELEKRAQEAERAAENAAKAKAATTPAPAPKSKPANADLKRKSTLTGNRIDVQVERNGQVVRHMNAEMNLPNVLATVFTTTRGDRGEVPFAVAKDGAIYTRTEADKMRVASFGDVAKPNGPAMARLNDWIIVTTEDKSGSGLRMGIARPVGDSLATLRRTAARNSAMGLLFIAVALIGIVPLSTSLTRNLTVLNDAVSRIARGEYHTRVPAKTTRANDEVGRLAVAFNKMAADVEHHQQTAVEQERIRRELELGREIQNEMLPHAPLHLGLTEVQGVSVPAREVGGDFFNYFVLDSGQIALLMGDVSGKGVGAALLMANIQASLRIRIALGQDLSAVADSLDRDIDANSPGPVYATLFIGLLDPVARRLRYVNAGHNPQYVLRTGSLERMPATGLPVGLLSGRGYAEQTVQLSAGDQLFFYTDGCVEAENERGDMFGIERLEPLLMSASQSSMPLKAIEDGIAAFRGTSEPADDATLMTVKVG
jgi:serine phosphatase RsbU (regulator of sigma subunit)